MGRILFAAVVAISPWIGEQLGCSVKEPEIGRTK
jgi:hypothetical protein